MGGVVNFQSSVFNLQSPKSDILSAASDKLS